MIQIVQKRHGHRTGKHSLHAKVKVMINVAIILYFKIPPNCVTVIMQNQKNIKKAHSLTEAQCTKPLSMRNSAPTRISFRPGGMHLKTFKTRCVGQQIEAA